MISHETGMLAGSGVMLVAIGWAVVSLYATGPGIAARSIEKSGWKTQCERCVIEQAKETHQDTQDPVGNLNCRSMSLLFGELGAAFCKSGGDQLIDAALAEKRAAYRAAKRKQETLIRDAAENAGTRCQCAVSTTIEKHRIPFGIYAGSLRLVTPVPVANLKAELGSALRSPPCRQKERG